MGFGSYDESEQQNQDINGEDDGEGVFIHENDHEGEIKFEADATTDDLVDQLHSIRESDAE